MSSFPAQVARVRDAELPLQRRLLALRECVLRFAPYGFRATWHHLVVSAGLPVYLEEDPDSLVRAVDELEEARGLWLAETHAYQSQRRREKAAGRRQPRRSEGWHALPERLAFCPDPALHPRERLATVVHRLLAAYRSEASPAGVCLACEAPCPSLSCTNCGACFSRSAAHPRNAAGVEPPGAPRSGLPWQLIWHRAVPLETTVGGGDIAAFRAEFTPTSHDGRFGIFQIYVRNIAVGDATTTALYPHVQDLRAMYDASERPGSCAPQQLILGDTFDHLEMTLETTEQDMIFAFSTRPEWCSPPPWAPRAGRRMRLMVRRSEVIEAWREAEPHFRTWL
ncbi:hypothetical protein [Catellatospora methionotrophica]|uniref:hypothetical protein n=1 Tax=Catellatospora methionotrophica TaxID=121620 RepID=UPI0033E63469